MTNMEVDSASTGKSRRNRLTGLIAVAMIVGVCVLVRQIPSQKAIAQAPSGGFRVGPQQTAKPAATTAPAPAARKTAGPTNVAPAPTSGNPLAPSKELKVMAVVNGEQIKPSDLGRECVVRYGVEVLESMINRALIQQACKQVNVTITEKDIDDEIERVASKFGLSVDRWMELLKQERGVNPEQYRREIIWPTIALRQLAAEKIEVTPDELRLAFETEFGPQVKVRIIGTSQEAKAREAWAKARANPEQFAELAKQYCEDSNIASVGGAIPPIRKHLGDPNLERTAYTMKEGQVSDVIKAHGQYFVLKCEAQIPERYVAPQYEKQETARLTDKIRDQKLRLASQDLFGDLQKQAKVVNVFNNAELKAKHPGVAAFINNSPITMDQLADECVQRHGKDVLEGEINRLILTQELKRRGTAVKEEDLQSEVAKAAVTFNCVKKDGSPDVEKWLKQVQEQDGATVELYIRDAVWPSVALKKLVADKVSVTPEDLQKGFDSNYGPRVEVLAIVLTDQRLAQRVWEMARNNPTDVFFGQLAAQYSIEPVSRSNNGKVPPVRKFGGQPTVEDAAFKLKAGELSGIIAVGDKSVILRCQGRTQPVVEKMEEVRDELTADILDKKMNTAMTKEFERLRESSQVDNFLAHTSQSGRRGVASPGPASGAKAAGPELPTARMGSIPVRPASATSRSK